MLYCFDKDLPFDYSTREMEISKQNRTGLLYDSKKQIFTDFSGCEVDINEKLIFARTGCYQIYDLNNQIISHGGTPLTSNKKIEEITHWPNFYQPERKIEILTGQSLINNTRKISEGYGEYIFIKTIDKDFASLLPVNILEDKECVFYNALKYHLENEFIISEPAEILNDEYGTKEYRCFVINNEIYNISRNTTSIFHQIDKSILKRLEIIVSSLQGLFPASYVVDLMEYEKGGEVLIDVVEFNPIEVSGPYLYNSIFTKSDDILHSNNQENVSQEFISVLKDCSYYGLTTSTHQNLYNLKGSFSYDLMSLYLTGKRSNSLWTYDKELTIEDFSRKVSNKGEFTEFSEITDTEKKDQSDIMAELLNYVSHDEALEFSAKIYKLLLKEKGKIT